MDAYIGTIMPMGFGFAPRNWATCSGQILAISTNTALFSLLGTTFGGDGRATFGLPDLRGRMVVGQGQGTGLSPVQWGQIGGNDDISLNLNQLPSHSHVVTAKANGLSSNSNDPANAYLGGGTVTMYDNAWDGSTVMNSQCVVAGPSGGNVPMQIRNPYLGMYYCICQYGIFPSRN